MGPCPDEPDPDEVLARFGYAKPGRPAHLPHLNSAPPGPLALAGAAGEWLFPLAADSAILAVIPPALEQEMADKDSWVLPAGLVAIRENLAYEFGYAAPDRSGGNLRSAHYRLIAVRAPSGERVTFTYGPNGLDFEATWTDAKVQVALDAVHPSETFRQVEARLRITYAGSQAAAQGYTVSVLLGTEDLAPSETPANTPQDASTGAKAIPPAFRNPLQVVRVQEDGSGETVEFSYRAASAVSIAGPEATRHGAPTVLKEIAFPWRSLWLDWAPQPWPDAPARTGDVSHPESEGSFGVKTIYEKGAATYMRVSPGSPYPTPEPPSPSGLKEASIGSWVRQSRHFAFAATPSTNGFCRTFVRDRWVFKGTNQIPNPDPPQRYRSFDYAFNGDIPTFEWDRQERALVPVVGQMTRRLDWEPGTNLPPDLHRAGHQGKRMTGGLKGGNPGAAVPGINPGLEALKALAAQATAQGQRVLAEQEAKSAARFAQMEAQIWQANARHQAEVQAGMAAASAEYRKRQMENEIKDREEQLKKREECLWQQTEELKQRSIILEQQTQELEKQADDLRKQAEELIK
jgi:YD repeat-containing protein